MTCLVVINSSSGEYDWVIPFFKTNTTYHCILVLNEIPEEAKKKIRLDVIDYKNINLYEPVYVIRIFFSFIEKLNRRVSLNFKLMHIFYGLFYKLEYFSGSKFLLKDESFRQSILISYLEASLPMALKVIYPHSFGMQIPFNGIEDVSSKSDVVLSNTDLCKRFKSKKNIVTGIPHQENINLFNAHSKNIIFLLEIIMMAMAQQMINVSNYILRHWTFSIEINMRYILNITQETKKSIRSIYLSRRDLKI